MLLKQQHLHPTIDVIFGYQPSNIKNNNNPSSGSYYQKYNNYILCLALRIFSYYTHNGTVLSNTHLLLDVISVILFHTGENKLGININANLI